ncbi:MAG: sugar ABC transporter substrate-binding protein [Dehalococcoidia bacterium]|nr:MAG: sugar ABC transporter substrate-binding protein [Dehalococcoidia bacterium]
MDQISRRSFLVASAALGGAALAGCNPAGPTTGGASAPAPAPTKAPADITGELTIWNGSSQMTNAIKQTFQAAYPNLKVNLVDFGGNDLQEKLLVALATQTDLPDITWVIARRAAIYLRTNQFLEMDDLLKPYESRFDSPSAIVRHRGRIYSYVQGPGNVALWVNAEQLRQNGIDIATFTTWDATIEAAKKLARDSGGQKTFLIQPLRAIGFNTFNTFFHSRSGNWWTEDGQPYKDGRNLQTLQEVFQFWIDLKRAGIAYENDWVPPTFWQAAREGKNLGYQMNFAVGANNTVQNLPEQSGQWRMVTWPKWGPNAPNQTGAFGGVFYAVLKNAKNLDAARAFMTFWLEKGMEEQIKVWGISNYKPATELPIYQEGRPFFGGQKVQLDMSRVPYPPFNYWDWDKMESEIGPIVEQAAAGQVTAAQAVDLSVKALEKIASERR